MVESVVQIVGVKIKGRILVNRRDLAKVLGISNRTLTNRMTLCNLKEYRVDTQAGEMFDLERCLSIKVLPKS